MASVVLKDVGPSLFAPDADTPNGVYITGLGGLAFVIGTVADREVVEVSSTGSPSVTPVASYGGQIRELSANDLIEITG